VPCGSNGAHVDGLVVATDGACRGNGAADARAAIGVYFGAGSRLNDTRLLVHGGDCTSNRAELRAAAAALHSALHHFVYGNARFTDAHPHGVRQLVIKSDSTQLVRGMTEWIWRWRCIGFRGAGGNAVMNADLYLNIDSMVEALHDTGIAVLFWLVPREHNREADALANSALD
jgi:ribonuclease HI